ncbi:hypothetical protein [Frigoriglobus tundricola]|uniref:Glycosyltransferase RgtA/B/C/D-like domain-containing protein n=1 Tax=Frigoriglobus tundricola TaxID=2774151 RepID=A0A6M5YIN9_9BACT|nr:hypothetical protein [Frigoriglobus tundricola]QJW93885.1 hypothetical protein FTUN_1399 [Frigoriglobus tundricola]
MSSTLAVIGHVVLDLLLGWALLGLRTVGPPGAVHLPAAFLLGLYAETLFVGSLVLCGVPLLPAMVVMAAVAAAVIAAAARRGALKAPRGSVPPLRWYEWLVLVSVAEKVAFACWQLARLPLYFDDASTHWSGRARALFGGVNWSVDPESPVWLGTRGGLGHRHYPLLAIVWRAETAVVSGGWDDLLARADGVLFLVALVATVWAAVWDFSRSRWLAALGAFVTAAIPLLAWHAAAGYSDIAVAAFSFASLAALLRREWLLAGVLAAGAAWSKNDGLVLFLPATLVGTCLLAGPGRPERLRAVAWFLGGCATLAPWLVAKYVLSLGVTPNDDKLSWHPDTFELLWDYVVTGPTSSILWVGVGIGICGGSRALLRDRTGRALLAALAVTCVATFFVFGCTSAHVWLSNQMTVHRIMLQIAPLAVFVSFYAAWLRIRPDHGGVALPVRTASVPARATGPSRSIPKPGSATR